MKNPATNIPLETSTTNIPIENLTHSVIMENLRQGIIPPNYLENQDFTESFIQKQRNVQRNIQKYLRDLNGVARAFSPLDEKYSALFLEYSRKYIENIAKQEHLNQQNLNELLNDFYPNAIRIIRHYSN